MIDVVGKVILAEGIKNVLHRVRDLIDNADNSKLDRDLITEAIIAIDTATTSTRNFIDDRGFTESDRLRDLWHNAMRKCVAAGLGDHIPEFMRSKANYWGRPKDWTNNPEKLSLVPKLDEIEIIANGLVILLRQI